MQGQVSDVQIPSPAETVASKIAAPSTVTCRTTSAP